MEKFKKIKIIVGVISALFILLIIIGNILIITSFKSNKTIDKIPVIEISLNGINQEEINSNSKNIKYKDNQFILSNNNRILHKDIITIKGRGHNTWNWPKRPYQISFENDVNLLDLGKSKKYVLLANYADPSLLRNHIAFYIADLLDMKYSMLGKSIGLYIDDEYQGIYYMTNKVDINKGSVDLKDDYGLLVELDNVNYISEDYMTSDYLKDNIVFKECKKDENMDKAKDNFKYKYNEFEKYLIEGNWDKLSEYIDVDSFAKYYIVQSISTNGDGFRTSFYMYQDGLNSKISAGPVWDFDMGFENNMEAVHNYEKDKVVKNIEKNNDNKNIIVYDKESELFNKLLEYKEFKVLLNDIWNKYLDNKLDLIIKEIDNNYELLKDDAKRNNEKWNYSKYYSDYVDSLKSIVKKDYNKVESDIKKI